MAKIIDIHTGVELEYPQKIFNVCSICETPFVRDEEGGVTGGMIGMIPVNFCPYCLSGVLDMARQMLGMSGE